MLKSVEREANVWQKVMQSVGLRHVLIGNLYDKEVVIVIHDDNDDDRYCIALTRFGLGSIVKTSLK